MADPKTKTDPKSQLEEAAVHSDDGKLRGHHVITVNGDLVLVPPPILGLAADVERGVYVTGLKDGQRLATKADVARKRAEEKERQAKEAATATPAA